MQQIADWLEKLGLSEYAQRFAENDIDFTILPDLTDQDLKDLGVSLGHRRKLLRAIANLETSDRGTRANTVVSPGAPLPPADRAADASQPAPPGASSLHYSPVISTTRTATIRRSNSSGIGRSAVNRMVAFSARNGARSAPSACRTISLAG